MDPQRAAPEAQNGPRVAIAPHPEERLRDAIAAGGGIFEPETPRADALIWTDPGDARGLAVALDGARDLRWVQLPFAGIEGFFERGAIRHGPVWTCAKGIYGPATAEHALTLLLAGSRLLHEHLRNRRWEARRGFGAPERRLKGATVLIVGTGGIGRALAEMLAPLRPRVLAVNRGGEPLAGAERTESIEGLSHLLPQADHVVVAAPLTKRTRGMFNEGTFALMKESAWLINVARGPLVVTDDLVAALRSSMIGGAALDVTDPEPLPARHPLWKLPNAIVTPHVANTWDMAFPELSALVTRNVSNFASGRQLEGQVDVDAGY